MRSLGVPRPSAVHRVPSLSWWREEHYSPVAQLAEHPTVNRRVAGSSPARGAKPLVSKHDGKRGKIRFYRGHRVPALAKPSSQDTHWSNINMVTMRWPLYLTRGKDDVEGGA